MYRKTQRCTEITLLHKNSSIFIFDRCMNMHKGIRDTKKKKRNYFVVVYKNNYSFPNIKIFSIQVVQER